MPLERQGVLGPWCHNGCHGLDRFHCGEPESRHRHRNSHKILVPDEQGRRGRTHVDQWQCTVILALVGLEFHASEALITLHPDAVRGPLYTINAVTRNATVTRTHVASDTHRDTDTVINQKSPAATRVHHITHTDTRTRTWTWMHQQVHTSPDGRAPMRSSGTWCCSSAPSGIRSTTASASPPR